MGILTSIGFAIAVVVVIAAIAVFVSRVRRIPPNMVGFVVGKPSNVEIDVHETSITQLAAIPATAPGIGRLPHPDEDSSVEKSNTGGGKE